MWAITIFTTYICVSVCSALWEHTALLRVQVIFAFSASTVQVVFIKYRMEKLNRNTRYGTPAKESHSRHADATKVLHLLDRKTKKILIIKHMLGLPTEWSDNQCWKCTVKSVNTYSSRAPKARWASRGCAYRKSCMRNRLPPIRGRLRSYQSLRHIRHWISRKPLEIDTPFQKTTNRKWPMGYQMATWPMTSRTPKGVKLVTPICLEPNILKTAGDAI